jgi:hypothetical protein
MNQLTFEDARKIQKDLEGAALLNPSVPEEEELRLTKQVLKMYRLFCGRLHTGCKVSTIDLIEIGCQYSARLLELRQALIPLGWCIDMVKSGDKGVNHFSLVKLEDSTYYKKWLKKHQQ